MKSPKLSSINWYPKQLGDGNIFKIHFEYDQCRDPVPILSLVHFLGAVSNSSGITDKDCPFLSGRQQRSRANNSRNVNTKSAPLPSMAPSN